MSQRSFDQSVLNYRLGSYVYHREGRFAGKFFCIPHSTETALEKYKYKKKIDEIQATEQKRKDAREKTEKRSKHAPTAQSNRDRLLEPKKGSLDRGATPERMTYEASIEMSEESGLEQIDEDEWTDRNFGNSTANDVNTSDDSISDLESDDDERGIKAAVANESGGPLTVRETRRLAKEWRARYKGSSCLKVFPSLQFTHLFPKTPNALQGQHFLSLSWMLNTSSSLLFKVLYNLLITCLMQDHLIISQRLWMWVNDLYDIKRI